MDTWVITEAGILQAKEYPPVFERMRIVNSTELCTSVGYIRKLSILPVGLITLRPCSAVNHLVIKDVTPFLRFVWYFRTIDEIFALLSMEDTFQHTKCMPQTTCKTKYCIQ
jgi:hypothetical protein